MTWQDVSTTIGKTVPLLGTLLAPATGGASIAVAGIVSSILGVENTPDAVIGALSASPDKLLELKKYEMEHSLELQKLQLNEAIVYLQDTQSARARQTEHEKATGASDVNLYTLAWMIVLGFFALIITMIFVPVPTDSSGVVFMLFGSLSAGFGSVIGYFFGSSKSSNDKTSLLVKAGQK